MQKQIQNRPAFTLIEVIMAVIIVVIVVTGAMEMQGKNQDMAFYISKRGSGELDNSLFLTQNAYRYDKDEKDAFELIRDEFEIKEMDSREALKKIVKKINITEEQEIPISLEENGPPLFMFYSSETLLKGEYPARYYNFRL